MKKFTLFFAALMACTLSFAATTFEKVTTTPTNWNGEYVIVYEATETSAYVWNGVDAEAAYATTAITDGLITADDLVTITIASMEGGYSISINGGANDGKYIGKTADDNSINFDVKAILNTLAIDGSNVTITSGEPARTLRFNDAKSKGNRFRFYKTGQKAIQLYKKVVGTDIPATAIALDPTLELEQYKYTKITATLTPADATTAITWTSSDEKVATVSAKGVITALTIGTTTITATAGELTATCTVTVKEATPITCAQAVEIAKTVSANNEIAAGGKYVIRGYVTEMASKDAAADIKQYGNYSVWMADTKDGGKVFEAFQVAPADGKTIVAVGDYVEVIGDITKYTKGEETTYETVGKGAATIKVLQSEGTAVENIKAEAGKAVKVIENGQLIIIRGNVRYNAVGTVIE